MANDIAEKEERLKRQLDFCLEIDKEKTIVRETYLADESRKETDAEHAWHMAVMAMVLSEYANKKVDTGRVIQMLLIHDLVEIYAGDTFAYDAAGAATQSLDRFQPMMLNAATDGRAWNEHGVKVSQVMKRNARTHEGSEALWAWQLEHFIKPNAAKGRLKED